MPHPSSAFVRLLLRAYPRHLRQREADVLEAACIECLARERRRLGRFGAAYACGRLIADTSSPRLPCVPTSAAVGASPGLTCHLPLRRRSR